MHYDLVLSGAVVPARFTAIGCGTQPEAAKASGPHSSHTNGEIFLPGDSDEDHSRISKDVGHRPKEQTFLLR